MSARKISIRAFWKWWPDCMRHAWNLGFYNRSSVASSAQSCSHEKDDRKLKIFRRKWKKRVWYYYMTQQIIILFESIKKTGKTFLSREKKQSYRYKDDDFMPLDGPKLQKKRKGNNDIISLNFDQCCQLNICIVCCRLFRILILWELFEPKMFR